jgi:16S rRNA (cytidine1402-2'-O)-methyltransferase
VLRAVGLVACEDTRTTRTLLAHYGIAVETVALHEHNERKTAARLVAALQQGKSVALVSDAGTPGISDPGAWLVAQAHAAGIRVSPVPGPNAAVSALSASGFPGDHFLFAGFVPASRSARLKVLQSLQVPWPVVLYEAPHRIRATIDDLIAVFGPQREACIARELTKKFEEVTRLPLGRLPEWIGQDAHREQGEFVIVLAAGEVRSAAQADAERVLAVLLEELAPSEAAKLAARITGLPKAELYRKALARRK